VRHLSVVTKVAVPGHATKVTEDPRGFKVPQIDNEPECELTSTRVAEFLKQCIGQLPQAQKDSLLLKEEASLSVKDIATVLNTSFEASKSRLRYVYENLRQCLNINTGRAIL
jgi:RNA polymerase sigma-70 factor (ECF subfamily)